MPEGEEELVHVQLWKKEFDRDTGEPLFKPFDQKYSKNEWKAFLAYPNGFTVKQVYHLPKGAQEIKKAVEEAKGKA